MAELNKEKMSSFTTSVEIKDDAKLVGIQDNDNVNFPIQSVIGKIVNGIDEKYLRKDEKIPNENINFGEVVKNNQNVINGNDVFESTNNNNHVNLVKNPFDIRDWVYSQNIVIEDKGDFLLIKSLIPQGSISFKVNNINNEEYYCFSAWVRDVRDAVFNIGDDSNSFQGIAQSKSLLKNSKNITRGKTKNNSTYAQINFVIGQGGYIELEKVLFTNSFISFDVENITYNKLTYIPNFDFGFVQNSGIDSEAEFFTCMNTRNLIDIRDVSKIKFNTLVKEFGFNFYYMLFDNDFNTDGRKTVNTNAIDVSKSSYIKLVVGGVGLGSTYINPRMFDFTMDCFYRTTCNIKEVKNVNVLSNQNIYYHFKRNLNLDITSTSESNHVKYSANRVLGNGFLLLPPNYKNEGKKTRLIIFAHGSANTQPTLGHYAPYVDYLVKQGYAVADCHAWGRLGSKYIGEQFYGSKTNYIAYESFVNELINRYNFYDEIFLFGKSQGGMQVYGLPYNTSIQIKAACSLAGESSAVGNQFGYIDSDKFAYFEDMAFSGLEKDAQGKYTGEAKVMYKRYEQDYEWTPERVAYIQKNIQNWIYWNPIMSGVVDLQNVYTSMFPVVTEDQTKTIKKPQVPFICFVARDDLYYNNRRIQVQIQNGGGTYIMRLLPSGNSNPHGATDISGVKMNITTDLGYKLTDIPIAFVEMLEFFKQYE